VILKVFQRPFKDLQRLGKTFTKKKLKGLLTELEKPFQGLQPFEEYRHRNRTVTRAWQSSLR